MSEVEWTIVIVVTALCIAVVCDLESQLRRYHDGER